MTNLLQQHCGMAVLSIELVLIQATNIKPWVAGGQLNVFQKMDIITRIAVQEREVRKGTKLQCVPDCSCVFCYTEIKG